MLWFGYLFHKFSLATRISCLWYQNGDCLIQLHRLDAGSMWEEIHLLGCRSGDAMINLGSFLSPHRPRHVCCLSMVTWRRVLPQDSVSKITHQKLNQQEPSERRLATSRTMIKANVSFIKLSCLGNLIAIIKKRKEKSWQWQPAPWLPICTINNTQTLCETSRLRNQPSPILLVGVGWRHLPLLNDQNIIQC